MRISTRAAGYLPGNLEHHLDHLAPFCSLMEWPLIVTDEDIFELAIRYYPDLQVYYWNSIEAPFEVTQQFEIVVTTLPRPAFDEIFFIAEASLRKRLRTLWLPHGNSDKGHLTLSMEALSSEETLLVYGPKMVDFLAQKQVIETIKNIIPIGNFRWAYFQKHRDFYNNILDAIPLKDPFILYAPTWNDREQSSSFEMAIDAIIQHLSHFPLVVKPHPNATQDIRVIQKRLSYDPKVTWLEKFPPIYPLLEKTSHLIGDFSSIGYDFLRFNRPMLFFNASNRSNEDAGRFLHRYGESMTIDDVPSLPSKLKSSAYQSQLQPMRRELYRYTFGDEVPWELVLEKVKQLDI